MSPYLPPELQVWLNQFTAGRDLASISIDAATAHLATLLNRPLTVAETLNCVFYLRRDPTGQEWSNREVARQSGLAATTIQNIRTGKNTNLLRETMIQVVLFFDVPITIFFPDLPPPPVRVAALVPALLRVCQAQGLDAATIDTLIAGLRADTESV